MTGNRVVWSGLEELKAALRQMPAALAQEGSAIVYAHARSAQQDIVAGYPSVTGRLRGGVRVTLEANARFGAGAVLKSAAPHAHLYEFGTKRRQTKRGWNRGVMPKAPLDKQAIPKIIRWRVRMYSQLAAMLERHGLKVSGSFGRAA